MRPSTGRDATANLLGTIIPHESRGVEYRKVIRPQWFCIKYRIKVLRCIVVTKLKSAVMSLELIDLKELWEIIS